MSDADARKWPPFMLVELRDTSEREFDCWVALAEHESCAGSRAWDVFLHRDAARAWQTVRDFLDGKAEQWMAIREFAQEVLDVANELDHITVSSAFIRRIAKSVQGLEWNEVRDE